MEENIIRKLESSRKELLDFSLRNPLINFKHSQSRGVHVIDEKASFVFDFMVNQKKAMIFVPQKVASNAKIDSIELEKEAKQALQSTDNKLQTDESAQAL
ncbi:MAG: DUF4011 domain-containing protein, partial [Bacteroidia bacterium]